MKKYKENGSRFSAFTLPEIADCEFAEGAIPGKQADIKRLQDADIWEELEGLLKQNAENNSLNRELLGWIQKKDTYGLAMLWNLCERSCKECLHYDQMSSSLKRFLDSLYFPVK